MVVNNTAGQKMSLPLHRKYQWKWGWGGGNVFCGNFQWEILTFFIKKLKMKINGKNAKTQEVFRWKCSDVGFPTKSRYILWKYSFCHKPTFQWEEKVTQKFKLTVMNNNTLLYCHMAAFFWNYQSILQRKSKYYYGHIPPRGAWWKNLKRISL